MKIGIGIDTGGTCTDAVVYQLEEKKILAYAKTLTTKEDLSVGIGRALDGLPSDLIDQAEVIALSTTLATNACVENKGGRAKLVLFGIDPSTISEVGSSYGLPMDDTLYYIDSRTKPNGDIVESPDWNAFRSDLHEQFDNCDAVGFVEMYAKKTGAVLERKARDILSGELSLPLVCGHELFSEYNIAKRGASALLNARLIPVIQEFLQAVRTALKVRNIKAPFVIVRSDGSLMTEAFTATRPVETLLCGPVASVMGAVELSNEENAMIVDIGGTTTDIAFVKDGLPQRVEGGIRIGKWDTFVKGLFVDTFGLGGDSGIRAFDGNVLIETERVIPLCIAGEQHPQLITYLRREAESETRINTYQKDIYLGLRSIEDSAGYDAHERRIASILLDNPMSLEHLGRKMDDFILPTHIERLIREGVIIRCGITPTDAMHLKGDFSQYSVDAARYGLQIMANVLGTDTDTLCDRIYDTVKEKLYFNIVRILIEDAYPEIRNKGLGEQLTLMIHDSYELAKRGEARQFFGLNITTPAALIGVGAPTHIFLGDVAKLLHTKVCVSEYSKVANALGAIVGNVSASVQMEISYNPEFGTYTVFGGDFRCEMEDLDEAKEKANQIAADKALEEAILRGSEENAAITYDIQEDIADTEFGAVYIGYKVIATATGNLRL